MEYRYYINVLLRRWWVILLFTIVGLAASAFYSFQSYKPIYSTNITLWIVNDSKDSESSVTYSDYAASQQLVKEFKEVIKSSSVLKEVINLLKFDDLSAQELEHNINVDVKDDTRILTIVVTNKEPERAQLLAKALGEVFVKKALKQAKDLSVETIAEPELPTAPIPPQHKKKILLGILGGIIGAFALIFLEEELDDSIKTMDDVEENLNLKVLGTIPMLKIK